MSLFKNIHLLVLFFLFLSPTLIYASPLSTSNRWIVDHSGNRVKFACVSWPSHLLPMVAEGLNKRPLDDISKSIKSMGFNCVRFTWPLHLVTNESYADVTMRESLAKLGLQNAIEGAQYYNPTLLNQPVLQVFKEVVWNMDKNGLMVILDNHITTPGWCCSSDDDNGFFGDKYFNPDEWISGLTQMAQMFNATQNVVGVSLRNEPRGPKENVGDWYKYMQMGAEAVHKANPNLLVIVSGLNYDTDLSFLSSKDFSISFTAKLVFEVHWYSWSTDGAVWDTNANDACGSVTEGLIRSAGFLLKKGLPLFLSEWGVDQRGSNSRDVKLLGCLLGWAAEMDVDWSLWALQGSYYLRGGVEDYEEVFGALNSSWDGVRSPGFIQRISALQTPFQGPGLNAETHTVLFHPATGYCVTQHDTHSPLRLGSCMDAKSWIYTEDKTIQMYGTNLYLKAQASSQSLILAQKKENDQSFVWDLISNSKMHVSTRNKKGDSTLIGIFPSVFIWVDSGIHGMELIGMWVAQLILSSRTKVEKFIRAFYHFRYGYGLCLDVGQDGFSVVTSDCRCLSKAHYCDPQHQWFKMVSSSRPQLQ